MSEQPNRPFGIYLRGGNIDKESKAKQKSELIGIVDVMVAFFIVKMDIMVAFGNRQ